MKTESPSLVLQFSPEDGVKQELAATAEATSIPPRIIAAVVVRSCRGRFREIVDEALATGGIGPVLSYHVHQRRPTRMVAARPPRAKAPAPKKPSPKKRAVGR